MSDNPAAANPQLSIVVPVYNECEAIESTCASLTAVCAAMVQDGMIEHAELLFVDDGSQDGSARLIEAYRQAHPATECHIRLIQFSRNFGHSAAVFAGLEHSRGDLVAIMDADLQDPPELLPFMIRLLRDERADVVYGKRKTRDGEAWTKRLTAWGFYRVINWLSGTRIPMDTGDFRVMTREVCDALARLSESRPFLRGLVAWIGFRQLPYEYDRQQRRQGETKYTWTKMIRLSVDAALSFSSLPLQATVLLGAVGLLLSTAFAAHAFTVWWMGDPVPGWTSLVIGFSFVQSVTLLVIGVIGLYVGRAHEALKSRPRYILRQDIR